MRITILLMLLLSACTEGERGDDKTLSDATPSAASDATPSSSGDADAAREARPRPDGGEDAGIAYGPTRPPTPGDEIFESVDPRDPFPKAKAPDLDGKRGDGYDEDDDPYWEEEVEGPRVSPLIEGATPEADIIHVEGDRLYLLSARRGLLIIDLHEPSRLRLIAQRDINGVPFEFFLRDGFAYVMTQRVLGPRLVALDVRVDGVIEEGGGVDLEGELRGRLRVGDLLYVVTAGAPYNPDAPNHLQVLDLSAPLAPARLDQLSFPRGDDGEVHVALSDERAYIATTLSEARTRIAAYDLRDPRALRALDAIEVEGRLDGRWQMDVHQGVLRVLTRSALGGALRLQTFARSERGLEPLGVLDFEETHPATLRGAHFDGERAYALISGETDALLLVDLRAPERPQVRGVLELPDWLYHITPRGDRLLTMSFGGPQRGPLTLSLFDVAELEHPTLLSRVDLEGGASAEHQARLRGAFNVDAERRLAFVPLYAFAGDFEDPSRVGESHSRTQIIDWAQDALAPRGWIEHRGEVHRARLQGSILVALSEQGVEAFDVERLDDPVFLDALDLTGRWVHQIVALGGQLVQLTTDAWDRGPALEITPPDALEPLAGDPRFDLVALLEAGGLERGAFIEMERPQLYAHEDRLLVLWRARGVEAYLAVLELEEGAPRLRHAAAQEISRWDPRREPLIINDKLILTGEGAGEVILAVFDLIEGAAPWRIPLEVEEIPERLLELDGLLAISHAEPIEGRRGLARFHLARFDLSGSAPRALPPINIPGHLIAEGARSGQAITLDLHRVRLEGYDVGGCERERDPARLGARWWGGGCYALVEGVNLVELDAGRARLVARGAFEGARIFDARRHQGDLLLGARVNWIPEGEGWMYVRATPELWRLRFGDTGLELRAVQRLPEDYTTTQIHARGDRVVTLSWYAGATPISTTHTLERGGGMVETQRAFLEGPFVDYAVTDEALFFAGRAAGAWRVDL